MYINTKYLEASFHTFNKMELLLIYCSRKDLFFYLTVRPNKVHTPKIVIQYVR